MGSPDEADRHFDDTLKMNERIGARPWAVHTAVRQCELEEEIEEARGFGDAERPSPGESPARHRRLRCASMHRCRARAALSKGLGE